MYAPNDGQLFDVLRLERGMRSHPLDPGVRPIGLKGGIGHGSGGLHERWGWSSVEFVFQTHG